jgi:phosphatidylinositol alpha-1,6-mannosyltransferase
VWFLPWAFLRTGLGLARGGVERVVCGDAIAWAAVATAVRLFRGRSSVIVMGLDLTFPSRLYQRLVRWSLPHADRIVAISSATASAAVAVGADSARIVVLHPGVRVPLAVSDDRARKREELVRKLDLDPGCLILLSLGRLVRRKGVAWFVEEVVPRLHADIVYLVAGDGPMRSEVEAATERGGSAGRVRVLGLVDDDERELLMSGCDVAVMPNIRVAGDMEGFGLVAVEAACRGAVVVAASIEGLADAVVDGVTGVLVEAEQADQFVVVIDEFAGDRTKLQRLGSEYQRNAVERYSVERMSRGLPAALGLLDADH